MRHLRMVSIPICITVVMLYSALLGHAAWQWLPHSSASSMDYSQMASSPTLTLPELEGNALQRTVVQVDGSRVHRIVVHLEHRHRWVQSVGKFFKEAGAVAVQPTRRRTGLVVDIPIRSLDKVLGVHMAQFDISECQSVVRSVLPYRIPKELDGRVKSIEGLTDFPAIMTCHDTLPSATTSNDEKALVVRDYHVSTDIHPDAVADLEDDAQLQLPSPTAALPQPPNPHGRIATHAFPAQTFSAPLHATTTQGTAHSTRPTMPWAPSLLQFILPLSTLPALLAFIHLHAVYAEFFGESQGTDLTAKRSALSNNEEIVENGLPAANGKAVNKMKAPTPSQVRVKPRSHTKASPPRSNAQKPGSTTAASTDVAAPTVMPDRGVLSTARPSGAPKAIADIISTPTTSMATRDATEPLPVRTSSSSSVSQGEPIDFKSQNEAPEVSPSPKEVPCIKKRAACPARMTNVSAARKATTPATSRARTKQRSSSKASPPVPLPRKSGDAPAVATGVHYPVPSGIPDQVLPSSEVSTSAPEATGDATSTSTESLPVRDSPSTVSKEEFIQCEAQPASPENISIESRHASVSTDLDTQPTMNTVERGPTVFMEASSPEAAGWIFGQTQESNMKAEVHPAPRCTTITTLLDSAGPVPSIQVENIPSEMLTADSLPTTTPVFTSSYPTTPAAQTFKFPQHEDSQPQTSESQKLPAAPQCQDVNGMELHAHLLPDKQQQEVQCQAPVRVHPVTDAGEVNHQSPEEDFHPLLSKPGIHRAQHRLMSTHERDLLQEDEMFPILDFQSFVEREVIAGFGTVEWSLLHTPSFL